MATTISITVGVNVGTRVFTNDQKAGRVLLAYLESLELDDGIPPGATERLETVIDGLAQMMVSVARNVEFRKRTEVTRDEVEDDTGFE